MLYQLSYFRVFSTGAKINSLLVHHTHEGSIGNLCNAEISALMQQTVEGFNFCGMEEAEKPWQGYALPTELFPRIFNGCKDKQFTCFCQIFSICTSYGVILSLILTKTGFEFDL